MGIIIHDAMAAIALGKPIDNIAQLAQQEMYQALVGEYQEFNDKEPYAAEQACLVEGLIRGFHKHVWPRLMAEYPTILYVEQEFLMRHNELGQIDPEGSFGFMAKPDLILQDKDGMTVYVEYKSTSSNKEEWSNSWQTAIQLHSAVATVEHATGLEIDKIIVQGLYKGYMSRYNRQESDLCYGYFAPGNPPFTKDQWSYEWRKGYNKSAVWRREGGVKQWVADMPDHILSAQFPQVPPITLNRPLVETFFRQQANREGAIREAIVAPTPEALDRTFPQRWENCIPSYGKPCGYRTICHGNVQDPLEAGFRLRRSHHDLEETQLVEADK